MFNIEYKKISSLESIASDACSSIKPDEYKINLILAYELKMFYRMFINWQSNGVRMSVRKTCTLIMANIKWVGSIILLMSLKKNLRVTGLFIL